MSIIPVSVSPKTLAQTISSTAIAFKLNNILGWDGQPLTPADFGTEAFCVFTNSTKTQIEIMKFDPATIANDSITILARGLGYSGGLVPSLARQYAWASNDTTVQLGTDAPQLFRDFLSGSNPGTITALHTYNVLPQSAVVPSDDDDFATKAYVDVLTRPAITVSVNQVAHGLVVGNVIRLSGIDTYAKAQANTPSNAEVVGIVVEVINLDNFKYITEGIVTTGVGIHPAGTVLFLSPTTAGLLTAVEPSAIGQVSLPLAVVTQSSIRMIFHKYRGFQINTIAGNPIASETMAGVVEQATLFQLVSRVDTGETGASLFVVPSLIPNNSLAFINSFTVTTPVTEIDFLNLGDYDELFFLLEGVQSSAVAAIQAVVSVDNGANWETGTVYGYLTNGTISSPYIRMTASDTASVMSTFLNIRLNRSATTKIWNSNGYAGGAIVVSDIINAIRFTIGTSIIAGKITAYGVKKLW